MKLRAIGLVAAKELRETLRDRRTLMVMILFPLVVYPLVSLLIAQVMANRVARGEAQSSVVSVNGRPDAVRAVVRHLGADRSIVPFENAGTPAKVESGALEALVEVGPAAHGNSTDVRILYDETRESSAQARDRVEHALAAALPSTCAPLFAVHDQSIAPRARLGGYLLSKILPLIVVVMVMLGAFYPAIDVTAGERERGTLETILSAPIDRFDLMAGKVLAVATLAAITGLLNMASMSLTVLEGVRVVGQQAAIAIPWSRAAATLLAVVPAAFLFASVMVAVGAMARGFKEAQTLLTPIYLLCFAPSMIAALGDYPLHGVAALVPGVNVTLLARDLVAGQARVGTALLVVTSTLACGALALALAARLYDSERLLTADEGGRLGLGAWLRRLLGGRGDRGGDRDGAAPPAPPGPGRALALYALAFLFLFLSMPLQARRLEVGLAVSEWGGLFGLVVVYARGTGQRLADVLVVRRADPRAIAGAALIGLSVWAVVGLLAEWILPAPEEVVESLRRIVAPPGGGHGLVVTLLLMAVTPAICEEALFRGPVLRGFAARFSPLASAILTGALFGLFHLDLWRLVPTGLIGVALSLIALESGSILPAMLTHFINNASLVILARSGLDRAASTIGRPAQVGLFLAASVVLTAGAVLVRAGRRKVVM
jgi:sodium transport system permease protein